MWTDQAQQAFERLKEALTSTPVLALPSLDVQFILEADASNTGIGAVLMQEVAYINKALAPKHQSMSVYEEELLAVVFVVKKWDHYVAHWHFSIRTDHRSLKFLLEQRITTSHQQKYIAKLFGYDFDITYKKGKGNAAANALSRLPSSELAALIVSLL